MQSAKKGHKQELQMSNNKVRLPKLIGNKSLATDGGEDTIGTIDQTQDSSMAIQLKHNGRSSQMSEHSSLYDDSVITDK